MTTSTKTNAATKIVMPSFDKPARAIILAKKAEDTATMKFTDRVKQIIQAYIDACTVAGLPRTVKGAKHLQDTMKSNPVMVEACKGAYTGHGITQLTFDSYALGAAKAFYHDASWHPKIGQEPTMKIPKVDGGEVRKYPETTKKAETAKPKKTGPVMKTTPKALLETLIKALEQAKLLNMDSIHGALLDVCVEIDADFKE